MLGFLSALIAPVFGFVERRQEAKTKAAERLDRIEEVKTAAKIKRIEQGDDNAAKLDEISLLNRGWKDEYLLLLTTAPVILAFVPDWAGYADAGFKALESVPEYYWYALGMIYIDTFGFRRMVRVAFEHWLSRRFGGSG